MLLLWKWFPRAGRWGREKLRREIGKTGLRVVGVKIRVRKPVRSSNMHVHCWSDYGDDGDMCMIHGFSGSWGGGGGVEKHKVIF